MVVVVSEGQTRTRESRQLGSGDGCIVSPGIGYLSKPSGINVSSPGPAYFGTADRRPGDKSV